MSVTHTIEPWPLGECDTSLDGKHGRGLYDRLAALPPAALDVFVSELRGGGKCSTRLTIMVGTCTVSLTGGRVKRNTASLQIASSARNVSTETFPVLVYRGVPMASGHIAKQQPGSGWRTVDTALGAAEASAGATATSPPPLSSSTPGGGGKQGKGKYEKEKKGKGNSKGNAGSKGKACVKKPTSPAEEEGAAEPTSATRRSKRAAERPPV